MVGAALLEVEGWSASRADGFVVLVDRLALAAGDAVAVLGRSGAGKTTLLASLLGLARGVAGRGSVRWRGAPLPEAGSGAWRAWLRTAVAVVPQDARAALDPMVRLGDQLRRATGAEPARQREALAALGIEDAAAILRRWAHEVSGGQAQRVLLAVALLRRPALVVLDEPNAGLDRARSAALAEALGVVRAATGAALLLATHDREFAEAVGARPHRLHDGALEPGWPDEPPWPVRRPGGAGEPPVLSARGITVRRGGRAILDEVDLALARGEVVGVLGTSGGGKTTLARVLTGHLEPDRGTVTRPASRAAVQMVFQDAYGSLTPHLTLAELLDETAPPGFDRVAALARVGLPAGCLSRRPTAMSGGERRRAALLRALSVAPQVLVLDEPTASLDRTTAAAVVGVVLDDVAANGTACVLITHDAGLAERVCDRTVCLDGRLS
jgi:peptide/nickel transport system ATP-binding protein